MSIGSRDWQPEIDNLFILRGPRAADFWLNQEEFAGLDWKLLQEDYFGLAWLERVHYKQLDQFLWLVLVEDQSCVNPCRIRAQISDPTGDFSIEKLEILEYRDGYKPEWPERKCERCELVGPVWEETSLPCERGPGPIRIGVVWFL
eukprot:GHVU01135466.1.p1 GENE.GHVU01135466.1~~GHVU01135466.1.p1  ORF type:complete len:146 (+),score=12.23 GHVU01135466.1:698-1135(+)